MKVEQIQLEENDWVPNNTRIPVLIVREALSTRGGGLAETFEYTFDRNGWPPQWRDTIYDYHHYHSTAHEALGVAKGSATLELGGPDGDQVHVSAGDALMLPAGTGHRLIEASDDFLVVGAYPRGQDWDICREASDAAALQRLANLPDPTNPMTGDPIGAGRGRSSP